MSSRHTAAFALALLLAAAPVRADPTVERVTTRTPFPRGMVLDGGTLFVLSRGRVRSSGGVSAAVDDRAGTLWAVDPDVAGPTGGEVPEAVRTNGTVVAEPTDPPFHLWDRASDPPQSDHDTDRPYCGLAYYPAGQSFFLCAFSGVDLPEGGPASFSKNYTDAIVRYDRRTKQWSDLDRHDPAAGDAYPQGDPAKDPPPHGWLKGPDNCLVVGDSLYAVAKDNSVLVRYDLSAYKADPHAPPPPGEIVLGETVDVAGLGPQTYLGHSALASRDGWLYVGYRTSSVVVRLRLNDDGTPATPVKAELVARFTPWNSETKATADLTDMAFGPDGSLHVVSALPLAIHRFTPDPQHVYDGRREGGERPWLDLAAALGKPKLKGENVLVDDAGRVFVCTGDGYSYQKGAEGTVYRVTPDAATPDDATPDDATPDDATPE